MWRYCISLSFSYTHVMFDKTKFSLTAEWINVVNYSSFSVLNLRETLSFVYRLAVNWNFFVLCLLMLLLQKCDQQSFEDIEVNNKKKLIIFGAFVLLNWRKKSKEFRFFFSRVVNHLKYEEKKSAISKRILMRNIFDKEKEDWTIQRYQQMKSEWCQTSVWSRVANLYVWITNNLFTYGCCLSIKY